ncbi:viral membrane formation [Cetacean poxvirus 1]|nr:viral membrane formation [Cetacean poxvirus 1]
MTAVPVTDLANEYTTTLFHNDGYKYNNHNSKIITTSFSEDSYPSNKHYELTSGQLTILKSVNHTLLTKNITTVDDLSNDPHSHNSPVVEYDTEDDESKSILSDCKQSDVTVVNKEQQEEQLTSLHTQTPSLSTMFDKDKRIKLLEKEISVLRTQKSRNASSSTNLENFTKILFCKVPFKTNEVNKRLIIVNHANLNQVPLSLDDLEDCSNDEIDRMCRTIKQYHEDHKRQIIITNVIIIIINVIEQVLLKLGFEEIKGLSTDVTANIIELEIGDDCTAIANKIGLGNSPVLNILLFIIKLFVRRIRIL